MLNGIKASSFVASNKVYLEARARQFCSDPKKTQIASGVVPKKAAKVVRLESLKKIKKKKPTPVTKRISGEIMALALQLNLRITVPEMKTLVTVAIIPIQVSTWPM